MRDLHTCRALLAALDRGRTMDHAARLAFTRLRRDLRDKARAAGIDPDAVIGADRAERQARAHGERPRSEARRLDPDDGWRGRVGGYGPVID